MATLAFSDAMALLGKAVWILDIQDKFVSSATPNLEDAVADAVAAAEGERYQPQGSVLSERFNAIANSVRSSSSVQAFPQSHSSTKLALRSGSRFRASRRNWKT